MKKILIVFVILLIPIPLKANMRHFGSMELKNYEGKIIDVGNLGAKINVIIYIRTGDCGALLNEKKYWNEVAKQYKDYPEIVKIILIIGGDEDLEELKVFSDRLTTFIPVYFDREDKFIKKIGNIKIQTPIKLALDSDSNLIYISWSASFEKEQQAFKEDIRRLVLTFK